MGFIMDGLLSGKSYIIYESSKLKKKTLCFLGKRNSPDLVSYPADTDFVSNPAKHYGLSYQ